MIDKHSDDGKHRTIASFNLCCLDRLSA